MRRGRTNSTSKARKVAGRFSPLLYICRAGAIAALIDPPRPRVRLFGPLPVAHPSEPRDRRDGGHLRSKDLRIERAERGLHGSRRKREVSESLTSGT